jgi:hypothetical protein
MYFKILDMLKNNYFACLYLINISIYEITRKEKQQSTKKSALEMSKSILIDS